MFGSTLSVPCTVRRAGRDVSEDGRYVQTLTEKLPGIFGAKAQRPYVPSKVMSCHVVQRRKGSNLDVFQCFSCPSAEETCHVTKASEASWSYSCDSKVSFDRVQILTPDFSGRRPPPTPPLPSSPLPSPLSPLPTPPPLSSSLSSSHLPSLPPSSLFASSTPSCRRSLACG